MDQNNLEFQTNEGITKLDKSAKCEDEDGTRVGDNKTMETKDSALVSADHDDVTLVCADKNDVTLISVNNEDVTLISAHNDFNKVESPPSAQMEKKSEMETVKYENLPDSEVDANVSDPIYRNLHNRVGSQPDLRVRLTEKRLEDHAPKEINAGPNHGKGNTENQVSTQIQESQNLIQVVRVSYSEVIDSTFSDLDETRSLSHSDLLPRPSSDTSKSAYCPMVQINSSGDMRITFDISATEESTVLESVEEPRMTGHFHHLRRPDNIEAIDELNEYELGPHLSIRSLALYEHLYNWRKTYSEKFRVPPQIHINTLKLVELANQVPKTREGVRTILGIDYLVDKIHGVLSAWYEPIPIPQRAQIVNISRTIQYQQFSGSCNEGWRGPRRKRPMSRDIYKRFKRRRLDNGETSGFPKQ